MGYFDLNLRNIDAEISGALDQIVFSSSVEKTVPIGIRAIDSEFQSYFNEVYEWVLDEDYFEITAYANGWYEYEGEEQTGWWFISYINAYYSYDDGNSLLDENDDPSDENNTPAYCEDYPLACVFDTNEGTWLVYGTFIANIEVIVDYTHFNQDARNTTALLDSMVLDVENQASASDVSQIETTVSTILQVGTDFPTPGEEVEVPGAIPYPDEIDKSNKRRFPKLGWLGYLLYLLDLAEWANEHAAEDRMVFHYTTSVGRDAIITSGEIINPSLPVGGDVYFTYLAYPNSDIAMELLALCGAPRAGYFIVKQSSIPTLSLFTRVEPIDCPDGTPREGGGWEATTSSPVSALPIRFIPIAENF